MTSDDLLGELLAIGKVQWMPGMLASDGCHEGRVSNYRDSAFYAPEIPPSYVPVWTDGATLGCLLALAREAWGDAGLYAVGKLTDHKRQWAVQGGHPHGSKFRRMSARWHATEAEALLAAIEAAPAKEFSLDDLR